MSYNQASYQGVGPDSYQSSPVLIQPGRPGERAPAAPRCTPRCIPTLQPPACLSPMLTGAAFLPPVISRNPPQAVCIRVVQSGPARRGPVSVGSRCSCLLRHRSAAWGRVHLLTLCDECGFNRVVVVVATLLMVVCASLLAPLGEQKRPSLAQSALQRPLWAPAAMHAPVVCRDAAAN